MNYKCPYCQSENTFLASRDHDGNPIIGCEQCQDYFKSEWSQNPKNMYATLSYRISERTIERAYENHPYPNADGTIDYYRERVGKFDTIAGFRVESEQEAWDYVRSMYPVIMAEEETQIEFKAIPEERV